MRPAAQGATTTSPTLSTSAGCRYSQAPATLTRQKNSALSLWTLQVSLRYEF